MHRPKGMPKTGGRRKGSRNKVTIEREEKIAASGLMPLDFALKCMRGEKFIFADGTEFTPTWEDMKWGAEKAMPYCHKKMPIAHEQAGPGNQPITVRIVQFSELDSDDDQEPVWNGANGGVAQEQHH